MPDLDIVATWTCCTNENWEMKVPSSKSLLTYTVRWGRLHGRELRRQGCQYGYTCSCKGFEIRGQCSHVDEAKRCGWNEELEPTALPSTKNGRPCCPKCSGPVTTVRVGV